MKSLQVGGDKADAQGVGLVQDVGRDVCRDFRPVGGLEDQPLFDGLLSRDGQEAVRLGATLGATNSSSGCPTTYSSGRLMNCPN